jgi:undecaprenyl-diphosphatase
MPAVRGSGHIGVDWVLIVKAIIMGLVEGLTEFLPISSTGHLIITAELLHFLDKDLRAVFEVAIQLGAILAVCWVYHERLWRVASTLHTEASRRFVLNLMIALLPAAVLGFLLIKTIKLYLFNPEAVAAAFIVGGLVILWAEKRQHTITVQSIDDMQWRDALKVGFAQALALIPGTSRSGATIIGGLLFGFSRQAATEFSFFLAIPTMFIATSYDLFKHRTLLHAENLDIFAVGFVAAFVSAMFAVRGLLRYIQHHDFTVFAWYRIVFGALVLFTAQTGLVNWQN